MGTYTFKIVVKDKLGSSKAPGFWLYSNKREIPGIELTLVDDDTWETTIEAARGETIGIVFEVRVKAEGGATISVKPDGREEYKLLSDKPLPPDGQGYVSLAWSHKLK